MELDDDEEDAGEDSSDEEDEPHSLVITLRYRKGASDVPVASGQAAPTANGVEHDSVAATVGQPEVAPALETPASTSQPASTTNGISTPIIPVAHQQRPIGNAEALPKLDGFFSAPTPPYSAPEEAAKPHAPVETPSSTFEAHPPQHSAPAPTASWQ
jgi:hypothetical protein